MTDAPKHPIHPDPAKRQDPKGDTVLKFNPSDSGTPALKAWFYPGERFGYEFVYPHDQATEIARANRESVLASESEAEAADAAARIGRVDESGRFASEPDRQEQRQPGDRRKEPPL